MEPTLRKIAESTEVSHGSTMEMKDHRKCNKTKDIQLQCESSLTLCIRVLASTVTQRVIDRIQVFINKMFTKNCELGLQYTGQTESATMS